MWSNVCIGGWQCPWHQLAHQPSIQAWGVWMASVSQAQMEQSPCQGPMPLPSSMPCGRVSVLGTGVWQGQELGSQEEVVWHGGQGTRLRSAVWCWDGCMP